MKRQKLNSLLKKSLVVIFTGFMVSSLISCSQKYVFLTSSIVPGAKGHVKVKKDDNKNYIINVELTDLAEIERVNAAKTTYVVWMETDEGYTKNLGQLKSTTSFLSKRHTASLQTISSFKPTKIYVTTEDGINVQYPGSQKVLTTDVFSK